MNFEKALFSVNRIRVLREIFNNSNEMWYAEIQRKLKMHPGAAMHHLTVLKKENIVNTRKLAGAEILSISDKCFIPLKLIFLGIDFFSMEKHQVKKILKNIIDEI